MHRTPFNQDEIGLLRQAIVIAEEVASDHYQISTTQWKRYRYDIQTLQDLKDNEITDRAFAQIRRYARLPDQRLSASRHGDFFKICLQDHVIRNATRRDSQIRLLPLAIYIVTHELIHVIRFARFIQRFDTIPSEREIEEQRVHQLTHQLLQHQRVEHLQVVLDAFVDCRTMETFIGST